MDAEEARFQDLDRPCTVLADERRAGINGPFIRELGEELRSGYAF